MDIRTLENYGVEEITSVFNEAFSDYFIPLKLSREAMAEKILSENISLELSAGAFISGRLAGFILHGYDVLQEVPTVYNAGTGVIPSCRGRNITDSIYSFLLPILRSRGIRQHMLEVIDTNVPAIRIYKRIGFSVNRELGVYKSSRIIPYEGAIRVRETAFVPSVLSGFASCLPSWQNSIPSILRSPGANKYIEAYSGDQLAGCAIYVETTGRVKQLAVAPQHRRKGIGTALLSHLMQKTHAGVLTFTNVDKSYTPAEAFLKNAGFEILLSQLEMKMVDSIG